LKKLTFIICFSIVSVLSAQLKHPKASPLSVTTQEVGLTSIKVEYSRPAVRGRKIFGGLVPYGRIWRVGANASTKITFENDVTIMGNVLEKGTYALYAFPEAEEWDIVFHENLTHWGDGRKNYNPNEDVLRIKLVPGETKSFQENFLITFDKIQYNGLNLLLRWANTEIRIPIKIDTGSLMEIEIVKQLKDNPTAQTYYEAARYYQEQHIKYGTALEYLKKAIELGGDTYYFYRVKSLVEAALGDFKTAISSAYKSMELAALQDKDEFVRMNEKNIAKWKRLQE
jgi:tetratricopeptide (TPR) repeat protein